MLPLVYKGVRVSQIYIYTHTYIFLGRKGEEERMYPSSSMKLPSRYGIGWEIVCFCSVKEEKVWTISFISRGGEGVNEELDKKSFGVNCII